MVLFFLFLLFLCANSELFEDSFTLFSRSDTSVGVVEQGSEFIEFVKSSMVCSEMDVESNTE